jgi:hypothetical protein
LYKFQRFNDGHCEKSQCPFSLDIPQNGINSLEPFPEQESGQLRLRKTTKEKIADALGIKVEQLDFLNSGPTLLYEKDLQKNESSARPGVSKTKCQRFGGFNRKAPSIRRNS